MSTDTPGRRLFFVPSFSNSYKTPPRVRISPPSDPMGTQATAQVVLDKRNGFITGIELTNPGSGYSSTLAPVTVEVSRSMEFLFVCRDMRSSCRICCIPPPAWHMALCRCVTNTTLCHRFRRLGSPMLFERDKNCDRDWYVKRPSAARGQVFE